MLRIDPQAPVIALLSPRGPDPLLIVTIELGILESLKNEIRDEILI